MKSNSIQEIIHHNQVEYELIWQRWFNNRNNIVLSNKHDKHFYKLQNAHIHNFKKNNCESWQ